MSPLPDASAEKVEVFIARWQGQEGGQERANYLAAVALIEAAGDRALEDMAVALMSRSRRIGPRIEAANSASVIDLHSR